MKFEVLAEAFQKLEDTSSRLQMTDILAGLFRKADKKEIDRLIYLFQGRVVPAFETTEIGMGEKFVEEAISRSTGYDKKEVEKLYRSTGDLGTVAEKFIEKKKQRSLVRKELTIAGVFENFRKIATAGGAGSQDVKITLLTELLNNASPIGARYVVRIPLGKLRLGIGDPTILDAFSVKEVGDKSARDTLERAYNLCSDLGLVAKVLWNDGLEGIKKFRVTVGKPIRPALAERLPSAEEIIGKLGKCSVEAKYDGFRLQVHKDGGTVSVFSRRLENMTAMFPDIVEAAKKLGPRQFILEGEALTYSDETGEYYSFQMTMQRKRKHGVAEMAVEYPLRLFVFDVLYVDGKDFTQRPYAERRKELERIIPKEGTIQPAATIVTDDPAELNTYFDDSISRGLEGIVAKDLKAEYVAGARKFAWIKLKRSYKGELQDSIDVVIVGYFKGRGARAEFGLGAFLGCVYDEKEDMFKTVAKCGSGLTEDQMKKLHSMLDEISMKHKPARVDSVLEPNVWVEPKYVVTLTADEITKSPVHTCGKKKGEETGYALRFPRLVSWIREDKKPEDATSVKEILDLYNIQKRVGTEEVKE
jgi:DNA ligase-1